MSATTPFEPIANLAAKLVAVMASVATVPKRGHNQFHNYDYATEADVSDAVRHAMIEARVVMIPSLVEIREREVTTRQQKQEIVTTVIMEYSIFDADTGTSLNFRMPGSGQDPGDKGLMKAITAATKYAQLKAFQLSTGDDPEADDDVQIEREPGSDNGGEGEEGWPEDADELPPDVSPTAPAKADCISEPKQRRLYALLGEAAKRLRISAPEMKERVLEKIREQLHVQQIEHLPWRGHAYERVCDWVEAQGRR